LSQRLSPSCLQDGGGLVSIEYSYKCYPNKKGNHAILKAYRDSDFAWREKFDPTGPHFKPVVIPHAIWAKPFSLIRRKEFIVVL
jgi:hypothetical protein